MPLYASCCFHCGVNFAKSSNHTTLQYNPIQAPVQKKTAEVKVPPKTKATVIGIIFMVLAIIHFTGVLWTPFVETNGWISIAASISDKSIGAVIFDADIFELCSLGSLETVMGCIFLVYGILFCIASAMQSNRKYSGIRLNKFLRLTITLIYLGYTVLLNVMQSSIDRDDGFLEEEFYSLMSSYIAIPIIFCLVLLISCCISFYFFEQLKKENYPNYFY